VRQVGAVRLGKKDSLIRSLIIHNVMSYWDQHGLNWTPHQARLEKHVLQNMPIDLDVSTIRSVLRELVASGALHRVRQGPQMISYRLNRRFANPLQPGYAREIDDLLVDPVPWNDALGNFFRIGLPNEPYPHAYWVPTFPHYFAQHVWMRGWLHALNMGVITNYEAWLQLVIRSVREAPVVALEWIADFAHFANYGEVGGWAGRAGETVVRSDFWKSYQIWKMRQVRSGARSRGRWMGDWPEEALAVLHALCGHNVGERVASGRADSRTILPTRILSEDQVYHMLDMAVLERVTQHVKELPQKVREMCSRFLEQPVPTAPPGTVKAAATEAKRRRRWKVTGRFTFFPNVDELMPLIRDGRVKQDAFAELVRYRRAWPRELYSPAW
jgi:hypothetical protein